MIFGVLCNHLKDTNLCGDGEIECDSYVGQLRDVDFIVTAVGL